MELLIDNVGRSPWRLSRYRSTGPAQCRTVQWPGRSSRRHGGARMHPASAPEPASRQEPPCDGL